MATEYDAEFFDTIRQGCKDSADVIVPIVIRELILINTVVDVGCGEGWWGKAFEDRGCKVLGLDGSGERVIPSRDLDLTAPLPDDVGEFGLAVCLEVAEHLPPHRSRTFIRDLCKLAPTVLFSAAIPGQGGTGHLNEQWPAYWVRMFEENGYTCSGALRWEIWEDDRVENWYRQNLIVATKDPDLAASELFLSPLSPVWPVVHPVLYNARRS